MIFQISQAGSERVRVTHSAVIRHRRAYVLLVKHPQSLSYNDIDAEIHRF